MLKVLIQKKGKGEELKWEHLKEDELTSIAATQALFGGNKTYVLTGALVPLTDMLEVLHESPHTFIFEEEKVLKAERTKLEKLGAKIEEAKKEKKEEWKFDQFGLAGALQKRDRKKMWLSLMAAYKAGEKAEAVAGLLAWKARAMKDVGLSRTLTFMYHDSHRGAGDLELLLERFALKL